jgi:hypothetical protein
MRSKGHGVQTFLIDDLKPAKAKAVLTEAALAFQKEGVDPKAILDRPEIFLGGLAEVNGAATLIFTAHHELLYYACAVPTKHLKRGKKMKGA